MTTPEFRAWDKERNEIVDVMSIDFSGEKVGVCNIPKRMFKDGRLHTIYSIEKDWNEVELMQYTGIKDKNGVEIYEGDIVKLNVPTYKTSTKVIYTLYDAFLLESNVETSDYIEILGNIYEHPDLLEELEE